MSKENYYQTKKFEWGSGDTAAVAGAIGAIGSAYFNSQSTPGYQPPAPTYNVYQLPNAGGSSGAPATITNSESKSETKKVLGMPTEVAIIAGIIILTIAGFAFFYFSKKIKPV